MGRISLRAAAVPGEVAARTGVAARRGDEDRLGAAGPTEATAAPGESRTKHTRGEFPYVFVLFSHILTLISQCEKYAR